MDESRPPVRVDVAQLLGTIERRADELALGEEPANFAVVLEQGIADD